MLRRLLALFDTIDREAARERHGRDIQDFRRQIWTVLISTAVILFAIHYLKYNSVFYHTVKLIESLFGIEHHAWYRAIRHSPFAELWAHVWWAAWHLILFLAVPMGIVKFGLRQPLSAFGWQVGDAGAHWRLYAGIVLFFIVFLSIFAHFSPSFLHYYPFYKLSHRSWLDWLAWEGLYMAHFVALEFFFRGFILQGLRVPMGSSAIAVMVVPYTMIHLPKLWPEAMGAILFGVLLGVLAIRSRSILGGLAIHASVALTLDISGVVHTTHLPTVWFP